MIRHPAYAAPELLARHPNELWSWDITKLRGPATWTYFYLYVMLDVFSRYVVGGLVAHRESATLAEQFIAETCTRHGIGPLLSFLLTGSRGGTPWRAVQVAAWEALKEWCDFLMPSSCTLTAQGCTVVR